MKKSILAITGLLFFFPMVFAQAPKPVLICFEIQSGLNASYTVLLDNKEISKLFVSSKKNTGIVRDSVFCANGFDAIKSRKKNRSIIHDCKKIVYDSLINIVVIDSYFMIDANPKKSK